MKGLFHETSYAPCLFQQVQLHCAPLLPLWVGLADRAQLLEVTLRQAVLLLCIALWALGFNFKVKLLKCYFLLKKN